MVRYLDLKDADTKYPVKNNTTDQQFDSFDAIYLLNFKLNRSTARNINYLKQILVFIFVFAVTLRFNILFHIIGNICYLVQNIFKLYLFSKAQVEVKSLTNNINDCSLPVYTILIPLYKEVNKIKAILMAMKKMNYPKDKLDIKLIVEEDDYETIKEIEKYALPSYIQIINVPFSLPRTKPKALNYAMNYVKGEYLVVYDAEDEPDPQQLKKAILAFQNLPKEYICVQAKLNFYNAEHNLLTKLFYIEYSFWFGYLLKGLSLADLPVTLGGTSNHFKTEQLRNLGNWDAYNVTEDAELGIRIYSEGYKVHVINCYTKEEAPIDIHNWLYQRARWIKGFMQTLLVFIGRNKFNSQLKLSQVCSIYVFIGLSTYSFFCLPWLVWMIAANQNKFISYIWLINTFFALSYMYGIGWYIIYREKKKIKNFNIYDCLSIIVWPFYFLLHTLACYLAIWQLLKDPFGWNKTKHGISGASILQTKNKKINLL